MLSAPGWRGIPEVGLALGLTVGALLTTVVTLLLSGLLGALVAQPARVGAAVVITVLMLARELNLVRFPMPQNQRLIPNTTFRLGPFLGSFQFGMELGSGVRTYVTSSLPYALLAVIALVAPPGAAFLGAVGFALGRLVMTSSAVRFDTVQHDGPTWSQAWDAFASPARMVNAAVYVICAAAVLSAE